MFVNNGQLLVGIKIRKKPRRCDKLLFMSTEADDDLGAVALPSISSGRASLWNKTRKVKNLTVLTNLSVFTKFDRFHIFVWVHKFDRFAKFSIRRSHMCGKTIERMPTGS